MKKRTVIMIMALLPFVLALAGCSNGSTDGDPVPSVQSVGVIYNGKLMALEISDPSGTPFSLAAGSGYHYVLYYNGEKVKEGTAAKVGTDWKCYGDSGEEVLKLDSSKKITIVIAISYNGGSIATGTTDPVVDGFKADDGAVLVKNIPGTYINQGYKIAADGLRAGGGNDSGLFWCGQNYNFGTDRITTIPITGAEMLLPVAAGRNKPWSNVELFVTITTDSNYRLSGYGGGQPQTITVQKSWTGVNFSGGIAEGNWNTGN